VELKSKNGMSGPLLLLRTIKQAILFVLLLFFVSVPFNNNLHDYLLGIVEHRGIFVSSLKAVVSGSAKQGSQTARTSTYYFNVYNLQPSPLSLDVKPSCGCLKASWMHAVIRPFMWRSFSVTMINQAPGAEIGQSVAFRSQDKRTPYVFAFLDGN